MENKQWHILTTRPLSPALLEEAAARSVQMDTISFIDTEPLLSPQLEEGIQALASRPLTVVFTSMNALEAVRPYLAVQPDWSVYCIGQTTCQLALTIFGASRIRATAPDAAALAHTIVQDGVKSVVFFCGNIRRDELPGILKAHHIAVDERIVYRTKETPQAVAKAYDGILFFSPSAVASFFSMNTPGPGTTCFAIGSTTATAIQQYGIKNVIMATVPGKEALARLAIDYFSRQKA